MFTLIAYWILCWVGTVAADAANLRIHGSQLTLGGPAWVPRHLHIQYRTQVGRGGVPDPYQIGEHCIPMAVRLR